jgi:DNA-binding beta-propeller fold protein YncE
VLAVLGDAVRRIASIGGREGMPRSLASVYGGSVTRFLGGGMRGAVRRVIASPGARFFSGGAAVSHDGASLLVSATSHSACAIHVFRVADGSRVRGVGTSSDEEKNPLQFNAPRQLCVDPDGFVFVADYGNDRIQALTPSLDFHGYIHCEDLSRPVGVCATRSLVVVSEGAHRITVINRGTSTVRRRFGTRGSGDGELNNPAGLCLVHDDRHIAVADCNNNRVCVFGIDGQFIRHVGVGVLKFPLAVASTSFDELVVADRGNHRIAVFGANGAPVLTTAMGSGSFVGVAVHGDTVFAQDFDEKCVVFGD